jgi:putative oxidoreductase
MKPFDALGRWAGRLAPAAPVVLRVAVAWVFLRHGLMKIHWGVGGVAGMLQHLGFPVATVWAVILIGAETVGAACVLLGFWTRFFAACLAVDMTVAITRAILPAGRAFELEGLLLAGSLALVALGDGPVSVGALIGRGKK